MIEHILLVFLLPALVVALSSLVCNGTELGIQLELALKGLENGSNCHNFFFIWRVAPQVPLVLSQANLCLAEVISALCVMVVSLPLR